MFNEEGGVRVTDEVGYGYGGEQKPNFKDPFFALSNKGMMAFSLVISYDFMVTFITIYFYWLYVSGGNYQRLYGIVFALYPLGSMVSSPVFARWGQKRTIKEAVIICLVIDAIGNALYFFSGSFTNYATETFWLSSLLLCVGRFISGIGGGGIVLGMNYLTSLSAVDEKLEAMNKFRAWIFWGKFAGPLVSMFFLIFIPLDTNYNFLEINGTYIVQFNTFTLPPATTIALCVVAIVVCFITIRDPKSNHHPLHQELDRSSKISLWHDNEAKMMLIDAIKLSVIFVVSLFTLWVIYAQVMAIGVFFFGIGSSDPSNIWYVYIPILIGAVGSLIFVKVLPYFRIADQLLLILSGIGVTASLISFYQFEETESPYIYLVGCTLLFFFNGILVTAFRSLYTRVVGQSRHSEMMNSLLFISSSIGQIVGPVISGLLITVDCPTGSTNPYDCTMNGLNLAVLVVMGIMSVTMIYAIVIFYVNRLQTIDVLREEKRALNVNAH